MYYTMLHLSYIADTWSEFREYGLIIGQMLEHL